jgi:hypothetical protein
MPKREKKPAFCFKCQNCGFGLSLTSGVPAICPICNHWEFTRISHEEFNQLETTEIR